MKLALVAELLVLGVLVMNLADQDAESAVAICDQVRHADNICCGVLENPQPENRLKIFTDIKTYIDSLDLLIKSIKKDKSAVEEACKDLIDDKPRGSKYMTITFDFYKLLEGFKWNYTEMEDLLDLRRSTMDKWVEIDKLLD